MRCNRFLLHILPNCSNISWLHLWLHFVFDNFTKKQHKISLRLPDISSHGIARRGCPRVIISASSIDAQCSSAFLFSKMHYSSDFNGPFVLIAHIVILMATILMTDKASYPLETSLGLLKHERTSVGSDNVCKLHHFTLAFYFWRGIGLGIRLTDIAMNFFRGGEEEGYAGRFSSSLPEIQKTINLSSTCSVELYISMLLQQVLTLLNWLNLSCSARSLAHDLQVLGNWCPFWLQKLEFE